MDESNYICINTDGITRPTEGATLFESRENVFKASSKDNKIAIFILAYNNLEKTKRCIHYYQKYASHIDHQLILFDNGSTDGTLEYLKTIKHPNMKLYHMTQGMGIAYGHYKIMTLVDCKYIIGIHNDTYIMENSLDNMLTCIESDPSIGFVSCCHSNLSNYQDVDLGFTDLDDLERKAAQFNKHSDPKKWEERSRLIGCCYITRKSLFSIMGDFDAGFFHDFADDDLSLRILRTGYKQMMCGDSFVHHDHLFSEKDQTSFRTSLEQGQKNFTEKHFLHPSIDVHPQELQLLSLGSYTTDRSKVLGLDCHCGCSLLDVLNCYRKQGFFHTSLSAFTTEAKYYHDLQFVTGNNVICDRIDFLHEHYSPASFDVIFLGNYLNSYGEPLKLLETCLSLLKTEGQVIFKLKNTLDLKTFLTTIGQIQTFHKEVYAHLSIHSLLAFLNESNITSKNMLAIPEDVNASLRTVVNHTLEQFPNLNQNILQYLYVKDFYFCVTK